MSAAEKEAKALQEEALSNLRKNARPPAPLVLSDNKAENWKQWKSRWDNYVTLSNLSVLDRALQVAQLENCLSDDVLRILGGLKLEHPYEQRTVTDITNAIQEYAVGEANETLERYHFSQRNQEEGEPFNKYLANLRQMIKGCKYCQTCESSILRDRLVVGIRDGDVREDLLKDSKLTLEKCINACKAGEAASTHKSSLQLPQPIISTVNKVHVRDEKHRQKREKDEKHRQREKEMKHRQRGKFGQCRYCGTEHEFRRDKCPAWDETCSRCGNKNHFAKCCPDKKYGTKYRVHHIGNEDEAASSYSSDSGSEDSYGEWVNMVKVDPKTKEIKCLMIIGEQEVAFQIDTGASCNLISAKYAKNLKPFTGTLTMWNNTTSKPLGICRRTLKNPKTNKKYSVP